MKLHLAIIILLSLCFCSCRHRIESIPPLSPPLALSELCILPNPAILFFSLGKSIYILSENGTLLEIPSGKKRLALNQPIINAVRVTPDRFLIQTETQLAEVTVSADEASLKPLKLQDNARLLAASESSLAFTLQDRLYWAPLNTLAAEETDIDPQDLLVLTEIGTGNIRLICRDAIYTRQPGQNGFTKTALGLRLTPPVSLIDDQLWAMDQDRRLLRYRLNDQSLVWARHMDHVLLFPMTKNLNRFLAITRSSAMLAVNDNGTQAWYAALGGLALAPPLIVGRRIAIPVRIRDAVQLRIYDSNGVHIIDHPLGENPEPPFMSSGDTLFYVTRERDKSQKLHQASTLFNVSSSLLAKARIPQHSLFPIEVKSTNLIEPNHRLTISNTSGEILWSAQIAPFDQHSPVWKAEHTGDYTLQVETSSRDQDILRSEIPFTVFDRKEMFRKALSTYLRYILPAPNPTKE